jgi:hypothetical protein
MVFIDFQPEIWYGDMDFRLDEYRKEQLKKGLLVSSTSFHFLDSSLVLPLRVRLSQEGTL